MPECMVVGERAQSTAWQLALENLGECWRCKTAQEAAAAYRCLTQQYCSVLVVCPGEVGDQLLAQLRERPPLAPPWVLAACSWADGNIPLQEAYRLPAWLAMRAERGWLPGLALQRHQQILCLARGLMTSLNVPTQLKVWDFLPDMLALCTVYPPLTEDLRGRLYPLVARRHALTPAAVERRLRLAIESTWSGASLAALERFFGHSVDPERGKPTNREFLFRVQERLMLAARRIA